MRQFLIRELEQYSGTKAHTIRTWENRYQLFTPARSTTNIRLYSLQDLRKLLRLRLLAEEGHKISRLAKMSEEERDDLANTIRNKQLRHCMLIDDLVLGMLHENVEHFELLLNAQVQQAGIDETIEAIVIPFLEKANILWYSSTSSDVHFAVTAVRRKIIYALERIAPLTACDRSALLFLPKDEHYDLILLYLDYKLKQHNIRVLYLGTDVSLSSIEKVMVEKRPDMLCTYITSNDYQESGYSGLLQKYLPDATLYIFHPHNESPETTFANIRFLHYSDVDSLL